ncbi:MAG: amidohydrolase [Deltaproteobacteria bacterium]|nr:amidohydrolase [Deltaproteobacteria bacterium]
MIIDIHTHLGDILNPGGGELIDQKGVRKKRIYDVVTQSELLCHRSVSDSFDDWLYDKLYTWITKASRARNATATLENMRLSMDAAGVVKSACMPIPPYLTFEDLHRAQLKDPGVIPFTGVDYTREYDLDAAFQKDVARGARGLKLHPIIQRVPLNSSKTMKAVEAFSVHRLPVLFHCGVSSYYLEPERLTKEDSSLGEIAHARDLVAAFPDVSFIAGHAGLFQYRDVMTLLGGFRNVMVDTSFQSPEHVRRLLSVFGPERVMYASDWPYGNRIPAIKIVKKACKGDKGLENRILYKNAAALLAL